MRIALDLFGGDFAPEAALTGAIHAIESAPLKSDNDLTICLIARESRLKEFKAKSLPTGIELYPIPDGSLTAENPINEGEIPDSPIRIALKKHQEGYFDAVVSAGSTGAQVIASLIELGKCAGITRPAIGSMLPTAKGNTLLLDVGASLTATPHHLVQFAAMGIVYTQQVIGKSNPSVGVLNVAAEHSVGERSAIEAFRLLKECGANIVGFVEGRELSQGIADVVVTNGFVGNVLLKFAEGLPQLIAGLEIDPALNDIVDQLLQRFDYHSYGGELLLGVKGVSIVCHGSSNEIAIANAISRATIFVKLKLHNRIEEYLVTRFDSYLSQVRYLRSFRRSLKAFNPK